MPVTDTEIPARAATLLRLYADIAAQQPRLTAEENRIVLEHRNDQTQGYIQAALHRARRQLREFEGAGVPVMPEHTDVAFNYFDLDPEGKYSVIDMRFAEREARIRESLQSRTPEVREYVNAMLDALRVPYDKSPMPYVAHTYQMMQAAAQEHRLCSRAAKLCQSMEGITQLYLQYKNLETSASVVACDKLFQGLEYAAGLHPDPVPDEIQEFYQEVLRAPLDRNIVKQAQKADPEVKKLDVEFGNPENTRIMNILATYNVWNKPVEEVRESIERSRDGLDEEQLHSYAVATIKRVLDPIYNGPEQTSHGIAERGGLIIVDGKTIREIIRDDYNRDPHRPPNFEDYYRQNLTRRAGEVISSALVAGKRVEAFLPDARGNIPKEPVQLVKTGYEPSPLKPEKFNAWHRFFSKFGYYKEKVDRKKEYEKAMAARERVQTRNRAARLKDFAARSGKLKALDMNHLFFNSVLERQEIKHLHHFYAENDWEHIQLCFADRWVEGLFVDLELSRKGRAPCSALVCAMAAQGYQFQDIIDPNKLQRERQDTVVQFVERGLENNQEWMGRTLYKGVKALLQQTDELTRGLDLRNEQQLMSVLPELASISSIAHFALTREDYPLPQACRQAYQDEAVKDLGDAAAAQKHTAEVASLVSNFNSFFNKMLDGKLAQYKLADPATTPEAFLTLDNTKTLIVDRILTSQIKQGNTIFEQVPDSKIISDIATAYYPEQDVTAVRNCLASPENQNLTRELAASGALANALVTKETAPPKKLPSPPVQRSLFMPNPEPVVPPKPQVIPHRAFHVKLELPAPRLEQQAPQRQEPRRQPPQMGGLGF